MKPLFFILLFWCFPLFASEVVIYDTSNNRVKEYIRSANTPEYQNRNDVVINPSSVPNAPVKYWKYSNGSILEMNQTEKNAVDSDLAAAATSEIRTNAKTQLDGFQDHPLLLRALADVIKDEINILRADIDAISKESAQITDRNRPDRTLAQLKTAIQNRIDSGIVD